MLRAVSGGDTNMKDIQPSIRLSAGTASVLGLKEIKVEVPPTTAYVMSGEKCTHNCAFCPQARGSDARTDMLSRVTWPAFATEDVVDALAARSNDGPSSPVKRVCFQVVHDREAMARTRAAVAAVRQRSTVPICVSAYVGDADEVEEIFAWGADRVSLPLDGATPEVYRRVKGGVFERTLANLDAAAARWPGRISTHLIVGLGETEEEMLRLMDRLVAQGITIGLFAFTPVRGTAMAGVPQPPLDSYRRIQAGLWLMVHDGLRFADLTFSADGSGRLIDFGASRGPAELRRILAGGEAFRTSGCPDCNRPYYNERPGGTIYNYPRPLTPEEAERELALLLSSLGERYRADVGENRSAGGMAR